MELKKQKATTKKKNCKSGLLNLRVVSQLSKLELQRKWNSKRKRCEWRIVFTQPGQHSKKESWLVEGVYISLLQDRISLRVPVRMSPENWLWATGSSGKS